MLEIFLIFFFIFFFCTASSGEKTKSPVENSFFKNLKFYGDFRFRPEYDWNSKNGNSFSNEGSGKREDRFRLRYRMRFGVNYTWNKHLQFGFRLRTGVPTSIQSPHVNFGYKGFGMAPFNLDKVFVKYKYENYWMWVGKNSFPFWKQNELFWDDDVTPEGLALGTKYKLSKSINLNPTIAYFMANNIPVNGNSASPFNGSGKGYGNGDNYGDILGAQLKFFYKKKDSPNNLILAFSYYMMNNIFISNELLHDAGSSSTYGSLNYKFLTASFKYTFLPFNKKWPVSIGYDFVTNLEDYNTDTVLKTLDKFNLRRDLKDQKNSHIASFSIGKSKKKGDWKFAYYFAHKEMFSVVSYYTEDDWARWGNIHANRNVNFVGHEFRLVYNITDKFNIMARYYLVKALKERTNSDNQLETNNRFRIDFNMKF